MIEELVSSSFNEEKYLNFLKDRFAIELKKAEVKKESKNNYIKTYKEVGLIEIDDIDEVGFFIVESSTPNIENIRVGFNNFIGKLIKTDKYKGGYAYDGLIVAIYHPNSDVWRLSYVALELDEKRELSTQPKRYTFELGKNIPTKTARNQLEKLNKDSTLEEIKEVFSVEKVTKEFFYKYKKLHFETLDYLRPQVALFREEKNLTLFTKKLLGRIVFLYFIQKKGWLGSQNKWGDGDRKFLSNQFKNFEGDNFYEEILKPIFFEALNVDRTKENYRFKSFGMMPYLNGGLFSPQEIDRDNRVIIENYIFKNIIDTFDQYNFTIIEHTPHESEVAVDPEMLGHIFEDLLEDRKEKGAFYTPREIVHYICQQSIKYYLETKPKEQSELEYIKQIKVLDPAIGSGAFPMGMLHEIIEKRQSLGDKTQISKMKREIIQNSIYGVDIEPSAVEIAKLRFWLSIVVDEDRPTPLPNLFYKIMVGNSLIETINGFNILEKENKKITKSRVRNLGNDKYGVSKQTVDDIIVILQDKLFNYFNEHNADKKASLDKDIKQHIIDILRKSKKRLDVSVSLFDETKNEIKKREENLERRLILDEIIEEYKHNSHSLQLFLYKVYFKDVFDKKGFDIVIGNPPYVRHEKIKELKPKLKAEGYKSYNGTADLYIYFFEQGYRLLKENGVLSFITSNKYTRAKYGKPFRKFVLENSNILEYIDFNDVKVFESATVDTSILSYRKSKKKNSAFLYCDVDDKYKKENELEKFVEEKGFEYFQSDLSVDSFSFSSPEELAIKKQIEKVGTPLKEWNIEINSGIKTGFNEAFIIDGKTKDELISKDEKSSELIKPLLRGRDIKRYSYDFADKWLINSHNNPPVDINNYFAIKEHLDQYYDKLKKRGDKGKTPYNLRNCAYLDEFNKEKIIYPDIGNLSFCFDNKNMYFNNTVYFLNTNSKYILAILNSKIIKYYYNFVSSTLGSGGNRAFKIFIEQLPIPQIPKEQQKPFEILVDYILFAKEQNMSLEAKLFESIIDGMVYDLYFEEEMKRGDCFISDEVREVLSEFDNSKTDEVYKIFRNNKTIQRGLIYRRVISVVKIVNGSKK